LLLRMFIVVSIYFVIDSVRKVLDTPSHNHLVSDMCILRLEKVARGKDEVAHY